MQYIVQFNIINAIFVKDSRPNQFYSLSSSWCQKFEMMNLCPWPSSFEPKVSRIRHSVEDCYCAKFQVIMIGSFCFIMLTYTPLVGPRIVRIDRSVSWPDVVQGD